MARLLSLLLALLLGGAGWLQVLAAPPPAWATGSAPLQVDRYRCDGDPLEARVFAGAVDAIAIPNTSAGTPPGAYVVLQWRDVSLQLPRTNNAGPPSYTDGRWWWSPVDPDEPQFRQRRGAAQTYLCERAD